MGDTLDFLHDAKIVLSGFKPFLGMGFCCGGLDLCCGSQSCFPVVGEDFLLFRRADCDPRACYKSLVCSGSIFDGSGISLCLPECPLSRREGGLCCFDFGEVNQYLGLFLFCCMVLSSMAFVRLCCLFFF